MFEELAKYKTVIVTGPHRTGTTICADMIGHDTPLIVFHEELFDYRNIIKAESAAKQGGVFQGPYLLPWTPVLSDEDTMVVYMRRDGKDIDASIEGLKNRRISTPFFHWSQANALWEKIAPLIENKMEVQYEGLRAHPLWVEDRKYWSHRRTKL